MPGIMKFSYDEAQDIVTAVPDWHVETEEDCKVWYNQWVEYMSKFGRKMDCIMVLDKFSVNGEIASVWGEYRAKVNNEHIRFGYRVNPELSVSLFVKTSGIRYRAATAEAASVKDAVDAILAARENV